MREALTDWQGMLHQETGPARRALQALLEGRLVFTPEECDGERFYTFERPGTISPIIAGIARVQRVWWPQRDLAVGRVSPCPVRRVGYGALNGKGPYSWGNPAAAT